jgi:hypothetical protein
MMGREARINATGTVLILREQLQELKAADVQRQNYVQDLQRNNEIGRIRIEELKETIARQERQIQNFMDMIHERDLRDAARDKHRPAFRTIVAA